LDAKHQRIGASRAWRRASNAVRSRLSRAGRSFWGLFCSPLGVPIPRSRLKIGLRLKAATWISNRLGMLSWRRRWRGLLLLFFIDSGDTGDLAVSRFSVVASPGAVALSLIYGSVCHAARRLAGFNGIPCGGFESGILRDLASEPAAPSW